MRNSDPQDPDYDVKLTRLLDRCSAAGIEVNRKGRRYASIALRNGRKTRWVPLFAQFGTIDSLLAIEFEKYVFLGDYSAIACYEDQTIEALIVSAGGEFRNLRRLFRIDDKEPEIVIDGSELAPNCKIIIGPKSEALDVLCRSTLNLSIRITGVSVSTHDDANSALERLSNSLFFQLDLSERIALTLHRLAPSRVRYRPNIQSAPQLDFPTMEYDTAPITLYWYGRASMGMPLLQFLAFYQCVEFFFHTHYQAELKRQIRNILKDPTFRPDRETDIGRVFSALNLPGRKSADERSMLRATIHECLDAATLAAYVKENDSRTTFFARKVKGLTDRKLPIEDGADMRDTVAERIYEIRCKIVHMKSGPNENLDLLLPFSSEAELLDEDIGLVEFVAQQVLIASSSSLKLM